MVKRRFAVYRYSTGNEKRRTNFNGLRTRGIPLNVPFSQTTSDVRTRPGPAGRSCVLKSWSTSWASAESVPRPERVEPWSSLEQPGGRERVTDD